MRKSASGFTITELLVVIVVITILTSIGAVTYSGVRNRGYDVSVQSDMRTIAKKLQQAKIETFSYPTANATIATYVDVRANKSAYTISPTITYNLLLCFPTTTNPTQYALLAQSKSGKRFYIENGEAISEYTGGTSWNTAANTICGTVESGWTASGAGYASGDTTTGPWRSWAGGN